MNTHPSEDNLSLAFKKDTVEFVTVAAAFCHFLENASHYERSVFIDKALKLAALLYLKALSLPAGDRINEADPETFVTEHEYNLLCGNIAAVMADLDSYVDAAHNGVFYEESTTQFISEKLADVYQSVKNFICVIQVSGMRFLGAEIWITAEYMRTWFVSNCSAGNMMYTWESCIKRKSIL